MLKKEQNDLVTQTGPGTPMGDLFRAYWLPILLSEELPENDCPPVRVKVLSERMIAFRDSEGKLGLIDEFCAHRGVSLWFGRNEEGGLRCPYHGWTYATDGRLDLVGQVVERLGRESAAIRQAVESVPLQQRLNDEAAALLFRNWRRSVIRVMAAG